MVDAMDGQLSDKIEEAIQKATANSAHTSHLTPGKDTRTQLFVGNLPYRVRWQDLKDLFRQAGNVLRADVSLGPDNRSRGYGTVLLATAEDAGRAIDRFHGYQWQTRILDVRVDRISDVNGDSPLIPTTGGANNNNTNSNSGSALEDTHEAYPSSGRNLFVGNLPFHIQWQDLKDLFRQAGTVVRADVALGADGRSRGFGTVSFASEHDAERAVLMFNGFDFSGRQLKVHHDKFTPQIPISSPSPAMNFLHSSHNMSGNASAFLSPNSPLSSIRHPSFPLSNTTSPQPMSRSPPLLSGASGSLGGFRDPEHERNDLWQSEASADPDSLTAASLATSMRLSLNLLDRPSHSSSPTVPPPNNSISSQNSVSVARAVSLSRAKIPPLQPSVSLTRSLTAGTARASSSSPLALPSTLPSSPRSSHSLGSSQLGSPISANQEVFPFNDMLHRSASSSASSSRRGSTTSQEPTPWQWNGSPKDTARPSSAVSNKSLESMQQHHQPNNHHPSTSTPLSNSQPQAARPKLPNSKTPSVGGRTTHPHHPGPISLPPLPAHLSNLSTPGNAMPNSASPGAAYPPHLQMVGPFTPPINGGPGTPYGMAPITPSMPPFTFVPSAAWTPVVQTPGGQASGPPMGATPIATNPYIQSYFAPAFSGVPATPPAMNPGYPVFAAPVQQNNPNALPSGTASGEGVSESQQQQTSQQQRPSFPSGPLFTPGVAMSPMSPYHPFPPGARVNPAVGGPVHLPQHMSPVYFSPVYYPISGSSPLAAPGGGDTAGGGGGYFDLAPPPQPMGGGYFPPMPPTSSSSGGSSGVEKAIMKTPEELKDPSMRSSVDEVSSSLAGDSEVESDEGDDEGDQSQTGSPSADNKKSRTQSEVGGRSPGIMSWHTSVRGSDDKARVNSLQPQARKAGWMLREGLAENGSTPIPRTPEKESDHVALVQ